MRRDNDTPRVALVGAGPGDPELLTLRAVRRLRDADVVLFDNLVGDGILELCKPGTRFVDVGKLPGGRFTTQDAINALLVREAASGARVVRLKGGDPFVFGRGGEEAIALREAGHDVEIVPGISSSIAAAGAAAIPVTHRGVSTSFTVVTGHGATADDPALVESWANLGRAGGTLVFLMGIGAIEKIVATLRAAGVPSDRPAAVVYAATTPDERVVIADLATIAEATAAAQIRSHAVLVVGDVVNLRDAIAGHALSAHHHEISDISPFAADANPPTATPPAP
jgi:uroporphyrin-III C-methyltransferase